MDLVRIRSDPASTGERGVLEFLRSLCSDHGLICIEQPTRLGVGRENLLVVNHDVDGTLSPGSMPGGLLLAGHADVVGPGNMDGWQRDPFEPWKDDCGLIHGRGATDMKGGIAAFVTAYLANLDAIMARGSPLVGMLFTVDEEVSLAGAKAFARSPLARCFSSAIVPEPTSMVPVRGHKGVMFARFTTRGKAAHGSVPALGINAITLAMDLYRAIQIDFEVIAPSFDHPVLGRPTMNLGVIRGGTAANVVPDACELQLDRRITPGETVDSINKQYQAVVSGFATEHGVRVDHEVINAEPPFYLDDGDRFLQFIQSLHGTATVMNGYTEAGVYFNDAGMSSVILGPGSIDQAHVQEETVDARDLHRAVDAFGTTIRAHIKLA